MAGNAVVGGVGFRQVKLPLWPLPVRNAGPKAVVVALMRLMKVCIALAFRIWSGREVSSMSQTMELISL